MDTSMLWSWTIIHHTPNIVHHKSPSPTHLHSLLPLPPPCTPPSTTSFKVGKHRIYDIYLPLEYDGILTGKDACLDGPGLTGLLPITLAGLVVFGPCPCPDPGPGPG